MTDAILLGLDGATWDVLGPLIDEGRLPNIEEVKEGSFSGTLKSTYPPTSGPAWVSMATGMNPGKTGVFYFLNKSEPNSLQFDPITSDDFRKRSLWDFLNEAGLSVGVLNYPMLNPPYEIDGFMVSGFGATSDGNISYPENLKSELDDVVGGYEVKVSFADPKYVGKPGKLYHDLVEIIEKRERAIEYLLETKDVDVFCGLISASDWAQHYYWKYFDDEHVDFDPETAGENDYFRKIWERIDEVVGSVNEIAEERNADLLLVSDHGFGPFNGTFYPNAWLEREGYRTSEADSMYGRLRTDYFPYLKKIASPIVSSFPALNSVAKTVGKKVRASPTDDLDVENSVAFATEKGFIHMASSQGSRSDIVASLSELFEENGLEHEIYSPEDLYTGPAIDLAPDVLYTIEGFQFALEPYYPDNRSILVGEPPSPSRSGGHTMDGIFAFSGNRISSGDGGEANITDILPTILFREDVPIPNSVDGTPLTEAFTTEFKRDRDVRYEERGSELTGRRGGVRSDGETDEVREQLQDLGYL